MSNATHRYVAARIRELARKRRKSLNVVAGLAGISRSHLGRLLRCEQSPTLAMLEKIAAALDVGVRDLLPPSE